ncbi:MAG: histidine--tRNA ligase [Candidatus Falkowbacteria bacterium]
MAEGNKAKGIVKPERPGGFLDFLPADYLARERIFGIIAKVFRSYGYDPIETPMVEFAKSLVGEDETSKNIFYISNKNKNMTQEGQLGLRFDHTVPFARLLAANPYNADTKEGIKLPWRRMVVGPVFRGESPQKGRYRQFYQFDVDIVGVSSMMADAEIVAIIYETLTALGLDDFVIKINNRKLLNGLAELLDVHDRAEVNRDDITKAIFRILDKLDKIGLDQVLFELTQEPDSIFDPAPNLSSEAGEKIKSFINIDGDNYEKLIKAKTVFAGLSIAEDGIKELEQILGFTADLGVPSDKVLVDFGVARGLDYYTGPVMETSLLTAPEFGSVFSGGRYNNLMERFTGQELPAVGASIGVDRLFAALRQLGLLDVSRATITDVLVMRIADNLDSEYLEIAKIIRRCGLNTEVSMLEDRTFKAQFNFALGRGVKYAIIYGENESIKRTIQIKNLSTRKQTEINFSDLEIYFNNI